MKNVILLLALFFFCCKKEGTHCWNVYDASGQQTNQVCNKTESQIKAQYPGQFVDRADAPKYCWKVSDVNNYTSYGTGTTENYANYFYLKGGLTFSKVDCSTCQTWTIRDKTLIKSSGNYSYGYEERTFLCGDTTSTLYNGRMILIREVTDTAYYIEFVQKD